MIFRSSLFIFFAVAFLFLISCRERYNRFDRDALVRGFKVPPDSTRPWIYWYWISDNISSDGITRDLEAMADLGIGTALIGNIFLPDVPRGEVKILSEEWYALMAHAVSEGKRLGVDIGFFNGPGWVQSGGPWVDSTHAMRYLTTSIRQVQGPQHYEGMLGRPGGLFQDVALLAYPATNDVLTKAKVTTSLPVTNPQSVLDGDTSTGFSFPVNLMTDQDLEIDLQYESEVTVRSLTVYLMPEPFSVQAEIQASSGDHYTSIKKFAIDRSNNMLTVGPIRYGPVAVSLPETNASKFRIIFSQLNKQAVWYSDVKRVGGITELELSGSDRLEHFVEKQLGKMYQLPTPSWKDYHWDKQLRYKDPSFAIDPGRIHVITGKLSDDHLSWNVPAGKWTILRVGMTPTGVTNAPVPKEAMGLDVDKMNVRFVHDHVEHYIGEIIDGIPLDSRSALKYIVADSYETGSENWTDGLDTIFMQRYGYDPMPWLPVLTGAVVGTPDQSDRFLWDLRRLVADQIATNYIGGLRVAANNLSLKLWAENYGHWGFPGEFLQYGGECDLVSGEFWAEGTLGDIECRAASSSAHIYGKNKVFAEALTAAREPFKRYPEMLRKRGDWSYTEGINHFVLHVYISQPDTQRFPGVNAWFGVEFNRQNTWFPKARCWMDYLSRNNYMLQQGTYRADVCYFIGEGAPLMTGIQEPPLPPGYSFDYINASVLMGKAHVEEGALVLPGGMRYRLMILPPLETMTPELLERINDMVQAGAAILGDPPQRSPGMKNFPDADKKVKALAGELWAGCDGINVHITAKGKGHVLRGIGVGDAMQLLGYWPDVQLPGGTPLKWIHRTAGEAEIYLLTNQSDSTVATAATFRVTGKQPELWDAVSGTVRLLPNFSQNGATTTVPLEFGPAQSYFLVFACNPLPPAGGENFRTSLLLTTLPGPWEVRFDPALRGPEAPVRFDSLTDWTENRKESIKYYSGTATYYTTFSGNKLSCNEKLTLSLGDVKNIAEVRLNGEDIGGVWTDPWELEITDRVHPGDNNLEVLVANTWVNRLIKDSGLPEARRLTSVSFVPYRPGDSLQPSGLLGPVTIRCGANIK